MDRRRIIAFLSLAATVALLMPGAARAEFEQTFTQKGVAAFGGWEFCESDTPSPGVTTCTRVALFAFEGTERSTEADTFTGTRVCLTVETFSFPEHGRRPGVETDAEEEGCATAPEGTLTIPRDLSTARVAPTTVTIACTGGTCQAGSSRELTVAADWVATGPLDETREHSRFTIDDCTEMTFIKRERREATASGTLDGTTLATTPFADISSGTLTFKSTCPAA